MTPTTFCKECGAPYGVDGSHVCQRNRSPRPAPISALDTQIAGGHYKGKKIQPVEYIHANGLNFLEGCVVKRITRWRDKPAESRFQDLEKIKHEIDLLIELESRA